ncbi:MAG: hypothetical protein J0M11_19845 [Anaerolineae bacterium]|nr:hypothetical protein [Anaerolineae bacterium]
MANSEQLRISIIEPTWNYRTHLPANLGLLRVVREAYPAAKINFVGGAEQIKFIIEMAPPDVQVDVSFHSWETGEDKDTLPTDIYHSLKKLRKLPSEFTVGASMILFSSCTATTLAAATLMRLASKSFAVLHGNANDLLGWRSRNPLRKAFDFHGAMKWYCNQGGTPIVLEEIIRVELGKKLPWLSSRLKCLPHPIAPEEAAPTPHNHNMNTPMRIAFAGNASIAKGFPEFIELVEILTREMPAAFEFHAFGYLPDESKCIDQFALTTKATPATLPRSEYVKFLTSMDYIFTWHNEKYYTMAASGVVYDAINFLVPLISRETGQIAEWKKQGLAIGYSFDSIASAAKYLSTNKPKRMTDDYIEFLSNMITIRSSLSIQSAAKKLKQISNKN